MDFTFLTFKELYEEKCHNIPTDNGVYVVTVPSGFQVEFSPYTTAKGTYKNKCLLYDADLLKAKYSAVISKDILYYGKANRVKGLRARIWEFAKYGYGECNNHRGGRAIWQIINNKELLLGYYICSDSESVEGQLLCSYKKVNNNTLPLANWSVSYR